LASSHRPFFFFSAGMRAVHLQIFDTSPRTPLSIRLRHGDFLGMTWLGKDCSHSHFDFHQPMCILRKFFPSLFSLPEPPKMIPFGAFAQFRLSPKKPHAYLLPHQSPVLLLLCPTIPLHKIFLSNSARYHCIPCGPLECVFLPSGFFSKLFSL